MDQATAGCRTELHSAKPFVIGWAIYSVVMLLALYATLILPSSHPVTTTDFRCLYSVGKLAYSDSAHLYDLASLGRIQDSLGGPIGAAPYIQPPYDALLFVPFAHFSYSTAYLLFATFNLALLLPCFFVARVAFSHRVELWQPKPGLMFFVFVPLALCVMQGQASIRLFLLCCLTWHELRRGRDFNAGLFLGLGLFKLQIVIPLALFLTLRRGYRALAGFVAGVSAVTALSVWFVGTRGLAAFVRALLNATLRASNTGDYTQPSFMPNLRGFIYGCGGRYLPHSWLLAVTLIFSAAALLWFAYRVRRESDESGAFVLMVVGALLLSYHLHVSDLTLLLLPIGLLASCPRRYFVLLVSAFMSPTLLQNTFSINFLWAIPLAGLALLAWRGSAELADTTRLNAPEVEGIRAATV